MTEETNTPEVTVKTCYAVWPNIWTSKGKFFAGSEIPDLPIEEADELKAQGSVSFSKPKAN